MSIDATVCQMCARTVPTHDLYEHMSEHDTMKQSNDEMAETIDSGRERE